MRRKILTSITTGLVTLFILTACTENSEDAKLTKKSSGETERTDELVKKSSAPANKSTAHRQAREFKPEPRMPKHPIMNQPVDFSTPENVENTLKNIGELAGPQVVKQLESKMDYMMAYDLSVGHNKEKLYKKLNGKTPNEIIAKTRR